MGFSSRLDPWHRLIRNPRVHGDGARGIGEVIIPWGLLDIIMLFGPYSDH